jgi:hypothetical protein
MEPGHDAKTLFAAEVTHHEMMQGGALAYRAVEAVSREVEQYRGGGRVHFTSWRWVETRDPADE